MIINRKENNIRIINILLTFLSENYSENKTFININNNYYYFDNSRFKNNYEYFYDENDFIYEIYQYNYINYLILKEIYKIYYLNEKEKIYHDCNDIYNSVIYLTFCFIILPFMIILVYFFYSTIN